MDITSNNFDNVNRMFQAMEVRITTLQQQVEILQLLLRQERRERSRFQKKLAGRFKKVVSFLLEDEGEVGDNSNANHDTGRGNTEGSTASNSDFGFESHLSTFDDVRAILHTDDDASSTGSSSVSSESSDESLSTPSNKADHEILDSFVSGNRNGTISLADIAGNHQAENSEFQRELSVDLIARQATANPTANPTSTPHSIQQNAMIPSIIFKDIDHHSQQNVNNEDLVALINDSLSKNFDHSSTQIKKRTLSNDFMTTIGSVGKKMQSSNTSIKTPIVPIRPVTAISKLLDEADIRDKWGVYFSDKFRNIADMWDQYQKISEKGVSIKSLEDSYSSKWRSNLKKNVKKKYNRRLIVIKAIETGIKKGKTASECISLLENFLNEQSKPVSHLYRKANLPRELI